MQRLWTAATVSLANAQINRSNQIVLRSSRKPTASLSSWPSPQLPVSPALFLTRLADFGTGLPWGNELLGGSCCRESLRKKKFFLELPLAPWMQHPSWTQPNSSFTQGHKRLAWPCWGSSTPRNLQSNLLPRNLFTTPTIAPLCVPQSTGKKMGQQASPWGQLADQQQGKLSVPFTVRHRLPFQPRIMSLLRTGETRGRLGGYWLAAGCPPRPHGSPFQGKANPAKNNKNWGITEKAAESSCPPEGWYLSHETEGSETGPAGKRAKRQLEAIGRVWGT